MNHPPPQLLHRFTIILIRAKDKMPKKEVQRKCIYYIDIKMDTLHCCLSPIYSPNSMGMMNMNHKSKKDPRSYFLFYPNPVLRDLIPLIEFN